MVPATMVSPAVERRTWSASTIRMLKERYRMSSHEIRPRYLPTDARRGLGWAFSYRAASASWTGGAGTSTVTVQNSSVHDFQKNGITGNEVGTKLTVSSNEVRGLGPTNGASENGIQLGFGATGRVGGNTVIDEIWAPDTSADSGDAAVGILIFDVADATVANNHLG